MEKPIHPVVGPKVSQIANIFQRKPLEITPEPTTKEPQPAVSVVRTESHATRFNNARALFEKLGVENRSKSTPAPLSIKMSRSGSRDDNLCDDGQLIDSRDCGGNNRRSPSPPKRRSHPNIASISPPIGAGQLNGVSAKLEQSKIHNISRIKSEDMLEKPEKPERKFNSRELIEKQKKWTSHFTKTKSTRSHSDPNRCDIIRTVPGTGLIPGSVIQHKEARNSVPNSGPRSIELAAPNEMAPPSPPARQMIPPEIKPRSAATKLGSPIKSPPPPIPATKPAFLYKDFQQISSPERLRSPTKISEPPPPPPPLSSSPSKSSMLSRSSEESLPQLPERNRKKSVELIDDTLPIGLGDKRPSIDKDNSNSNSTNSSIFSPPPVHPVSSSPSPAPSASSGPSSPVHTEDEKQENESTEKAELGGFLRNDSEGRSHKASECTESDKTTSSYIQKRSKKISSVSLNIAAAGLGSRPPSIVSSVSTDEGGFNEPSPEIKAKLKPAYSFDSPPPPPPPASTIDVNNEHEFTLDNAPKATTIPTPLDINVATPNLITAQSPSPNAEEKPTLNYVDVGYRLNPDGSESKQIYGEAELYQSAPGDSNVIARNFHPSNRLYEDEPTVYAIIKPEIPPPAAELFFDQQAAVEAREKSDDDDKEKHHHVRSNDNDDNVGGSAERRRSFVSHLDAQDSFENTELPALPHQKPPPPPEGPTLDLQDVKYVDASEGEEEGQDDNLPDAMTADEAERLLSSRQQSLLSDEQAKEVEEILSTQPSQLLKSSQPLQQQEDEPEWLKDVLDASNKTSDSTANNLNEAFITSKTTTEDSTSSYFTTDKNQSDVLLNHSTAPESLQESIVSIESTHSVSESAHSITATTIDESITSSKHNSVGSLADADVSADDSYIPEYPPVRSKEVFVESGVHYFEDGNFWMEVPGLLDSEEDDDDLDYPPITVKKNTKVKFSSGPIQVYSTFSVTEYDRRNEDVDPVAASAEYELEKRVEKMHVFPVELMKGPEGLGLSIIGMGVGADAGLEKLGIFVKTITDNGAAARDGRIQVNDQIIEVDGKSLVGVTQAYAASVLRNTSGLVKFQIGRERDPENSEVAQLIRLSLQADKEKEERLKRQQEEYLRRTLDYSEDSTQPASANSSVSEGPTSPIVVENPMEVEAKHSQEVESLKRLLQELVKLETTGNENELLNERLRQTERELANIKKEASNYQNMLQQSQAQYMALEKKYNKAKRLVREFQQREVDMVHREEFYLQLVQEKDTEYNALVKKLKDRVINLEQELQETQRKAGFPVILPYDSTSLKLTPQMTRRQPPKPLFQKLETELSDTEISDLSPDGEGDGDKTATVERKMPIKDELDTAVPQHELLDNSATKTKIDLASRGGLANRQLPTGKKSLSNSSSDCGLDSEDDIGTESTSVSNVENHQTNGHHHHMSDGYLQQNQLLRSQINQTATPLYAQVHKDRDSYKTHTTIPNIYKNTSTDSTSSFGKDVNSSYDSILGSNDKLSENEQSLENWMYPNRRRGQKIPPNSFTDQLNQVLADRERRLGDGSSRDSSDDYSEINKTPNPAAIMTQNLVVEIRQAVNEAQPKVKNVVPQSLSPPGTVPWQQQQQQGPPSPSSVSSSGSTSPGYSPSRGLDLSGSSTSFSSDKRSPHYWKNGPVHEWSKEQVCQWLMAHALEQHIPKFREHGVQGGALLQLDSREFKILGVTGEDKSRLKRRIKELKAGIEKERKDQERTRKEREKAIRKAEKKAEKAAKKK